VLQLFTDDRIEATTPFQEVQATAFGILPRPQLDFVATHIATTAHCDETAFHWEYLDTLAPQFKLQLRPIVLAVEFAASSGHSALLEAVQFLQAAVRKGRPLSHIPSALFPLRFVPDASRRYLYGRDSQGQRQLLPNRYEFLVYRLLRNGLEAGDIFCRDSVCFRSFEDDLLNDRPVAAKGPAAHEDRAEYSPAVDPGTPRRARASIREPLGGGQSADCRGRERVPAA
jgi:hypothetical protein